jgi:uncharacterized membrane protein
MHRIAAAGLFLFALLTANDAHAWFKFKNGTSTTVWVSFQWYSPGCPDGGDWETRGWWKLDPGQTKTVFGSDLQSVDSYYYYYAEASDGGTWSGPFDTCLPQSAFDWCLDVCCTPTCRVVGFREKYIDGYNNYTITLVK